MAGRASLDHFELIFVELYQLCHYSSWLQQSVNPLSAWMLLQGKLEGEAKLGTCATWLDSLPDLSLQLFQLSRVASE